MTRSVEENVSFPFPEGRTAPLSLFSLDSLRREDSRLRLRKNQAQKKSGPTFVLPALENTLGIDQ